MAFTQQINQANLQAQTRALNEQEAQRQQRSSQDFQSKESQKTRDYDLKKYNLSEGDDFLGKNPNVTFDETQMSDLGDAVAVEYGGAQEQLLKARDLITSGDTSKRIEGQMMMTKANNSLKKLGEELMILEADTEETANSDMIPDENSKLIKLLYKNNVEGTTKIVANKTATKKEGDENKGRYIQYKDEAGNDQWMSIDDYKKILKGVTKRQDVNDWLTKTKKNIEADESYKGQSIAGKTAAVSAHIDNYLSDPSVVRALTVQLGAEGKEGVKQKLIDMLVGAKEKTEYRVPKTTGRTPTDKQLNANDTASQRKYDVSLAMQGGKAGLDWLNSKFKSRSAKYGAYANKPIKEITQEGNELVVRFDDESGSVRKMPYTADQLHNLMNEIVYTLEDTRNISFEQMSKAKAVNFGSVFGETEPVADQEGIEKGLQNIRNSFVDKDKGTISPNNMEDVVNNIAYEFTNAAITDIDTKSGFFTKDKIIFLGKEYLVTTKKGDVDKLMNAVDTFIKERKGETKTSSGVGSKYNK